MDLTTQTIPEFLMSHVFTWVMFGWVALVYLPFIYFFRIRRKTGIWRFAGLSVALCVVSAVAIDFVNFTTSWVSH